MPMTLSDIVNLINDFFLTEDHKITVTGYGYSQDKRPIVFYNKEERGDIGRYLYHKPQEMVAFLPNFDRLYFSQRVIIWKGLHHG